MLVLPPAFFAEPAEKVAPRLVGCNLVRRLGPRRLLRCRIVEVEAYGPQDPACHAFRGPTARNAAMFKAPGHSYVYLIYGIYHCLNLVTDAEGVGSAVLVRAVEVPATHAFRRLDAQRRQRLGAGPGKLCQLLGVDRTDSGLALSRSQNLWVERGEPTPPAQLIQATRIGIRVAQELPWRWYDAGAVAVSKRARGLRASPGQP